MYESFLDSHLDEFVRTQRIHPYNLTVVIVAEATEDEVADLFYRLNNGKPLNAAEVRNCMPGKVATFVRQLAEHPFFKKCSFQKKRRGYDQMAAQMLCLELNGGSQEISDKALTPMYADYKASVPNKVVTAVEANLKLLDQMFPGKSRFLKRAAVVNLYLLVSYLTKHKKISNALKEIHKWFEKTEVKRRKDPEYKLLMTRGANGRPSIEGRFRWILSDFMAAFHKFQIVELDPQRSFNDEQKAEIFIRDGKKCQGTHCGGRIIKDGENWHADHILAWIKGGKTEVSNGRVLCPTCNLKKGKGTEFWEPVKPQKA